MKDINIYKKGKRQNTNEVCLGNGKRIIFKSKRAAGYFIADTNRFLTKCMVIINETYCSTFIQYRAMWLIAANVNGGKRTMYIDKQTLIKSSLLAAGDVLDKFNFTNAGSNDPYFAFIDLRKAALFVSDAAKELQLFNDARNLTANKYQCQILYERCLLVIKNLNEYNYVK